MTRRYAVGVTEGALSGVAVDVRPRLASEHNLIEP